MRFQGILLPPWPAIVSLRILGNRFFVHLPRRTCRAHLPCAPVVRTRRNMLTG